MTQQQLLAVLEGIIAVKEEQKQYLTELDNVIGDGDHGINMARGFSSVAEKMPEYQTMPVDEILKDVGKVLMKVVGGSSGPLYGSAFKKAGVAVKGKTELSFDDFLAMMDAAIAKIQDLGHAVQGEKTMLDAMCPAYAAMKETWEASQNAQEAFAAGVKAAEEGVEYTKTIVATKGRASYLGERSLGHQDPGATSFTYILRTIADRCK